MCKYFARSFHLSGEDGGSLPVLNPCCLVLCTLLDTGVELWKKTSITLNVERG